MTRALHIVGSDEPRAVFEALRDALSGGGAAVLARDPRAPSSIGSGASAGTGVGDHERVPSTVPQNVALVVETSGSTGLPKRVAISADALLASAAASASALGGQGQWILALPAHYVAGAQVLVRSLAAETEPVIVPAGHFDPIVFGEFARTMTADARFVSLVPVQLARLLDAAESDATLLSTLQRFDGILVGGQALAPALRERAHRADVALTATYGSSETSGGCVYDGAPIGNTLVRSVDDLLELSGSVLAEGYLADPLRTEAAFHSDAGHRWYRTGDLGTVEDGRVVVFGRADNVIISGGEKVLLDAVERSVRMEQGLSDAVVIAMPNVEWGQVPVVVVVGRSPISVKELRRRMGDRLGPAAAPSAIVEIDHLPMLASGKPDRITIAAIVESDLAP